MRLDLYDAVHKCVIVYIVFLPDKYIGCDNCIGVVMVTADGCLSSHFNLLCVFVSTVC